MCYCRANFFRAVLANELSVKCLWSFLERAVPDKQCYDSQWWDNALPKKQNGNFNFGQKFQREQIKKTSPKDWDMSVLAVAIENCQTLKFRDQNQREVVKSLQDRRNRLCHKNPAIYDSASFDQLFCDLNRHFTNLLGEEDGDSICQELTRIKKSK